MLNLFKKKKPQTEETATWSPPDVTTDPLNEIALCKACQFKGKCQFPSGCKTFRQIVETRTALIDELRGNSATNVKTGKPFYLFGVSWKEKLDRTHVAIVRINHLEKDRCDISISIKDESRTHSDKHVLSVPLSYVAGSKSPMVDIVKLRSDVRAEIDKLF